MSQHDFNIANQTASATRADLNNALVALATTSSSTSAPATTFANMMYYNTSDNWLYFRNEADSSWIRFAYFDQSNGRMGILDGTYTYGTGGTEQNLIDGQVNATWQAGTSTLDSLVSPNRIRLAIEALTDVGPLIAQQSVNSVGSYILARDLTWNSGTKQGGTTISGSNLRPTGFSRVDEDFSSSSGKTGLGYGSALSGTWRLMGYLSMDSGYGRYSYTGSMYLRIS